MIGSYRATLLKGSLSSISKNSLALQYKRFSDNNDCEEPEPTPRIEEEKFEPQKPAEGIKSMWASECCDDKCEPFRHDIVCLKTKPERIYTRTWNDCETYTKKKKICVGEILPPETFEPIRSTRYKKTGGIPSKRCEGDPLKLDLMPCYRPTFISLCTKIALPRCKPVPEQTDCKNRGTLPKCCQKRCTLYPAYSECNHPKPKAKHPIECKCLKVPPLCEIYEKFRNYAVK